jgi:hypothetical protein
MRLSVAPGGIASELEAGRFEIVDLPTLIDLDRRLELVRS